MCFQQQLSVSEFRRPAAAAAAAALPQQQSPHDASAAAFTALHLCRTLSHAG